MNRSRKMNIQRRLRGRLTPYPVVQRFGKRALRVVAVRVGASVRTAWHYIGQNHGNQLEDVGIR